MKKAIIVLFQIQLLCIFGWVVFNWLVTTIPGQFFGKPWMGTIGFLVEFLIYEICCCRNRFKKYVFVTLCVSCLFAGTMTFGPTLAWGLLRSLCIFLGWIVVVECVAFLAHLLSSVSSG